MKRNYYIALGVALAMTASHAHAQTQKKDTTLNRTVVVEQEYNPDISDASKVNVLPKVEAPTINKRAVEYATTLFPATSLPGGLIRPYTGIETQSNSTPGYVRAGYGNYGNLDVFANYLFRISGRDKLNVLFQMDGMDGKLKHLPFSEIEKWNAYYYRTKANIDYTHQFDKLDLNIAGNFGLSNFNFRPESVGKKQKFTSGDFHAGVASTDETMPIQFKAETNLMLYQRQNNFILRSVLDETQIRTKADVSGAINDEQRIHVALDMSNLFYGNDGFSNYTALSLNPYYEVNSDSWLLHLGANVDMAFGYGKGFRVSPDITAQYVFSDSYVVYAKATGGKRINDFRRLEAFCPYSDFSFVEQIDPVHPAKQLEDTYEQLNASLGFKASPTPGLWLNIYGGYQDLKDELYCNFTNVLGASANPMYFLSINQANMHNAYLGATISYDYKDILSLSASGVFRNWESSHADPFTLMNQPASELKFEAQVRPIPALSVNAGYDYVGRKKVESYKMSPISDLHLGAQYNLFKGISVYARLHNLLNKKYQYYVGYPTEGLNFLGGLSFRF